MGLGQRLTHSIASSFDFTCHSQKPAINSFVSAKGPSVTVRFSPEKRTRAPFELGWSPSAASSMPASTNSSFYFPISARSFSSGRAPASEFLSALTKIMNRIVIPPLGFVLRVGLSDSFERLYLCVERSTLKSTCQTSFSEGIR